LVVSNIIENGRNIGLADAGQDWYSDLSYVANPSRCSLLYALEVPVREGVVLDDTMFASAAWAYDTLPQSRRTRLNELAAVHRYGNRYRMQPAAAPLSVKSS
jgi:taurine dioxygenase